MSPLCRKKKMIYLVTSINTQRYWERFMDCSLRWLQMNHKARPDPSTQTKRRCSAEGYNMANFLLHLSRLSQSLDLDNCPCKIKQPEGCFNHADCQWSQAIVPAAGGPVPWWRAPLTKSLLAAGTKLALKLLLWRSALQSVLVQS